MNISSRLLARNTILSLLGRAFPLGIAVLTMPIITQGLGPERFGILALTWTLLVYFRLINLGLGHATTKFVAEALGQGKDDQLSQIIWTSLITQFLLGLLGCILFILATPMLTEQVLNVPVAMRQEVKHTFYILSLHLPILICSISLRGVLEAAQRFDLINLVFVPASSATFLVPTVGVWFNLSLPVIVAILFISTGGALCAYFLICWRLFPTLQKRFMLDITLLKAMVSFGGWATLSAILEQILLYADRLFLAVYTTLTDVGYYTVSSDTLLRLSILPASFAVTFFPAISSLQKNHIQMGQIYAASLKYLILTMGTVMFVLFVFAEDILTFWLGQTWASQTTLIFQILALGIFINALALVPINLLDGLGRPDLRAKGFLSYILIYLALLWFLVIHFGILGAAIAWLVRVLLDLCLFFCVVWKIMKFDSALFFSYGVSQGMLIYSSLMIVLILTLSIVSHTIWSHLIIFIIFFGIFFLLSWRYVLNANDKTFILSRLNLSKK